MRECTLQYMGKPARVEWSYVDSAPECDGGSGTHIWIHGAYKGIAEGKLSCPEVQAALVQMEADAKRQAEVLA